MHPYLKREVESFYPCCTDVKGEVQRDGLVKVLLVSGSIWTPPTSV